MENKIKQVHDYFVSKIVRNEIENAEPNEYTVRFTVEGYKFAIWVINGQKQLKCYSNGEDVNFMDLQFSEEEKETIYKNLIALKDDIFKQREIAILEEKLRKLKGTN